MVTSAEVAEILQRLARLEAHREDDRSSIDSNAARQRWLERSMLGVFIVAAGQYILQGVL